MKKILIINICLLFITNSLFSQNTLSPYSAKGLGESEPFMNAYNRSLGGVTNGIRGKRSISYDNAASLGGIQNVILDFGFRGDYGKIYNETAKKTSFNGNFNYFLLGFPVLRKQELKKDSINQTKLYKTYRSIWTSAIGINPYTNFNSDYFRVKDTSYGTVVNTYSVKGGLSRAFWMNAVNITPNLSLGLTSSYIFGQKVSYKSYGLRDSLVSRIIFDDQSNQLRGFVFNLGFQYDRNKDTIVRYIKDSTGKIKEIRRTPIRFVIGGTLENESQLNSTLYRTILSSSLLDSRLPIDTILNKQDEKSKIPTPLTYSAGFSVTVKNKWLLAFDYRTSLLSQLNNSFYTEKFNNSQQYSFGFAYRPDVDVEYMVKSYGKQRKANLEYRMGYRYLNTGLSFIDNTGRLTNINEYGISFGIGIPKLKEYWDGKKVIMKSMINISAEYIKRGQGTKGLIAEDLYRLTIGFNLSDSWFNRRKFN